MTGRILSGALPGAALTKTFDQPGTFAASAAAERYLEERGFSVGAPQGDEPRGLVFEPGVRVPKWRGLRPIERVGLHGQLAGDLRNGPIVAVLYDSAPPEAHAAFRSPVSTHDLGSRAIAAAETLVIVAMLIFALGSVLYVGWAPVWSRPETVGSISVGKYTNRAGVIGLRAAREARAP